MFRETTLKSEMDVIQKLFFTIKFQNTDNLKKKFEKHFFFYVPAVHSLVFGSYSSIVWTFVSILDRPPFTYNLPPATKWLQKEEETRKEKSCQLIKKTKKNKKNKKKTRKKQEKNKNKM